MNGYPESYTSSMENSRNCLKRIARNNDTEFSNQSVLHAMEKFVKTVNTMDETILVPCRLMDLKVGDDQDPKKENINSTMSSVDLFGLYNMLHTIKGDLLWGQGNNNKEKEEVVANNGAQLTVKGHVRRPSSISVTSTNSTSSISDSELDIGNENDSGIEEVGENPTLQVAQNFRRHLYGLTKSLKELTEAAQYLTNRYQHDIGSPI
ncbi:mid1-interacting protein 1-B [Onthophagus taurus]|uniref:mid1-interacting protein 1-B n=1 Tax=Onthophagus taurus TaxID=166361 RepID=UPI000C20BADA|nr:mid1-interacting protein 1-B [Onthophagus taurus]